MKNKIWLEILSNEGMKFSKVEKCFIDENGELVSTYREDIIEINDGYLHRHRCNTDNEFEHRYTFIDSGKCRFRYENILEFLGYDDCSINQIRY